MYVYEWLLPISFMHESNSQHNSAAPFQPANTMITSKTFGRMTLNITLTWDVRAERIDNYYITTSEGYVHFVNQIDRTAVIADVPYSMNITIEITAEVCGLQGESLHSVFIISKCMINYTSMLSRNTCNLYTVVQLARS